MSPFLLILLGALTLAIGFWFNAQPAARQRTAALNIVVIAVVTTLIVLTVLGRMHWLGGAFATLLIFLRKYAMIARWLPLLGKLKRSQPPRERHNLSRTDALATLGLTDPCSREDIINAHRRLLQRVHPDHGGNTYLAAQLNAARDLLLKKNV